MVVAVKLETRFISVGFELVGFLRQGKTIHSNQLRQTTAGLCVSGDLGTKGVNPIIRACQCLTHRTSGAMDFLVGGLRVSADYERRE